MKKFITLLLTFAALIIIVIFIFIPSKIKISSITKGNANGIAAHRILMNDETWAKWWPYEKVFQLDKTNFKLNKKMFNSFELTLYNGGDSVVSQLQFIVINLDTLNLVWSCELETGNNPIERFLHYKKARTIKKNLDLLLDSLIAFLSDQKNIYGFRVKKTIVTDSVLVSTHKFFDHYPDEFETEEIIKKLEAYIKANNAKQMNYPMLHVKQEDSVHFNVMAAIATDIKLPDNNEFASKMVLKKGNLLEVEINGGHATIRKAFNEYEKFFLDYEQISPAIPYQLIITDRTKERDTAKWITKLYYPVY